MTLVWWILGALALALALAALARGRAGRRRRERIVAAPPPVPAQDAPVPTPGPAAAPPATQSPLAPYLARALDRALPPEGGGSAVAWTHDEVRELGGRVVQRINSRTPGLALALVSFDRVTKVADARGTLRYAFDAQVHAASRNLSARVTVRVDVEGDREFIRDIAVHGAKVDASPLGAADLGGLVDYAAYEPVLRYEPQEAV